MVDVSVSTGSAESRIANGVVGLSRNYRPEIDGLRAFAVVAVVINHFSRDLLPCGYLGVDIFFVISGYVITASMASHQKESFLDFFIGFYERRIKRLVPALAVFVLVTSLLIALFNPEPSRPLDTASWSLLGLANLSLYNSSTNYFALASDLNPFTHTWSLGVEEQFYLVFPFIIWFSGFGRRSIRGSRNLALIVGLLSVLSLVGFVYLYQTNQPAAYFLMPLRFWELGLGCLVFLGEERRAWLARYGARVPPLSLVFIMVAVLLLPQSAAVLATLLIVFSTALLITSLRQGTAALRLFTGKNIVYVGLISYSLYLWHWGVLVISRWTIGIHWWSVPFQIGLIMVLAIGSYRWIELPLRRAQWSSLRYQTIGYGLAASLVPLGVITVTANFIRSGSLSLFTGRKPELVEAGVDSLTTPYSIGLSTWQGKQCVLMENGEVGKRIPIRGCTLGDFNRARHRILVIGNSFSSAFVQAFDDLVRKDGYAVLLTSSWDASPVKEVPNLTSHAKASHYYWWSVIPGFSSRLRHGDWVFMANDMSAFSPAIRSDDDEKRLALLERGLKRYSQELSARGISIAFLHGLPFAREAKCQPSTASLQWFNRLSKTCEIPGRRETLRRRQRLDVMLSRLQKNGDIRIIDVLPIFCQSEVCSYNAANGQLLYRDEFSHPSVEAARLASPQIRRLFSGN